MAAFVLFGIWAVLLLIELFAPIIMNQEVTGKDYIQKMIYLAVVGGILIGIHELFFY